MIESRHFKIDSYVKHTKIILTLVLHSRNILTPFQILTTMPSFFKKLKPAIKYIIISDCTFDGKMKF